MQGNHRRPVASLVLTVAVLAGALGSSRVIVAEEVKEHVVPATRCGNYFLVPISVDGDESRTLQFLYDTGASHTIIDPDSLERVFGKRVKVGRTARFKDTMTSGPITLNGVRARVLELDHLQRALSGPMDGILGFRAFGDVLLTIDYPADEMRVSEGRLGKADNLTIFDLDRRERARPWLPLQFADVEVSVLIDSGSGTGISLRERDAMVWHEEPVVTHESTHINRYTRYRSGRLALNATFAGATIENPVITLTKNTEIIGTGVLDQFVITFDQKRRRVRFIKDAPGPVTMEGIRGPGATFRHKGEFIEVTNILADSPAENAGLKVGDRLIAVDGRPISERECGQSLKQEDADQFVLTIDRDDGPVDITVPLVFLVP